MLLIVSEGHKNIFGHRTEGEGVVVFPKVLVIVGIIVADVIHRRKAVAEEDV